MPTRELSAFCGGACTDCSRPSSCAVMLHTLDIRLGHVMMSTCDDVHFQIHTTDSCKPIMCLPQDALDDELLSLAEMEEEDDAAPAAAPQSATQVRGPALSYRGQETRHTFKGAKIDSHCCMAVS